MEKYRYILFAALGGEFDHGQIELPMRPMVGEIVMISNQRCKINNVVHSTDGVTLELLFD